MFTTNTTKQAISKYGAATTMELWNIKIEILQRLIALQKTMPLNLIFQINGQRALGKPCTIKK